MAMAENKNKPTFVANSGQVDRDFDILDIDSLDIESFLANPVMLTEHNRSKLPIGYWDIEKADGQLLAVPNFASTEAAKEMQTLVEDKAIRALSVGFRPNPDSSYENEHGGFTFKNAELVEISFVAIPADPRATRIKSHGAEAPEAPKADEIIRKEAKMTIKKKNENPPEDEAKEANPLEERLAAVEAALADLLARLEEASKAEDEIEDVEDVEDEDSEDEIEDEEKALEMLLLALK